MKKFFKISYYILFLSSLLTLSVFAENSFSNNIRDIYITKNSVGKPEISLLLDKNDTVKIIKKDELEYVILMPETSSSIKKQPSLENVSDVIKSINIKTQPYGENIKGYTKITIRTTKPIIMAAKSVTDKTAIRRPEVQPKIVKKEVVKETPKAPVVIAKTPQKTENKVSAAPRPLASTNIATAKAENKTASTNTVTKAPAKVTTKEPVVKPVTKAPAKATTKEPVIKPVTKAPAKATTKEPVVKPVTKAPAKATTKEPVVKPVTKAPAKTFVQEQVTKPITTTQPKEVQNIDSLVKTDKNIQKNLSQENEQKDNIQKTVSTNNTQQTETNKDKPVVKKAKSFYISLLITGILLLLLIILKQFNKHNANVQIGLNRLNEQNDEEEQQTNNKTIADTNTNFSAPDEIVLPVHEDYEHKTTEFNEELSEIDNTEITENITEDITDNQILNSEVTEPEIAENTNEITEINDNYKPLEEEEIEELNDNTLNQDISPDEVFGTFEDEIQNEVDTSKDTIPNAETVLNKEEITPATEELNTLNESIQEAELNNNDIETEITTDIPIENTLQEESEEIQPFKDYISEQKEIKDEIAVSDNITEDNTNTEPEPKSEDDVVQSSYQLTPTKNLYLVNYNNETVLMASIKDEYIVLKKFDEIIDKPLSVRQTEKNTKKTTYIVRVGGFRGVVEVTMKNVALVLEL